MTMKPTIGVIQFPGSNCERETRLALLRSGMQPKDIFWNTDSKYLEDCDGFVIIGGFSYEDRLRSGVIASLNPLMKTLKEASLMGKPILGLCNGAQILMESGMVPGLANDKLGGALYTNKREISGRVIEGGYYNDWCDIKPLHISPHHAFTNQFKAEQRIHVPFAHAQGRFVLPQALFQEMMEFKTSLFQYEGSNPNGSQFDLAAISNKAGNVMAMMPHPERCEEGDVIFQSMKAYITSNVQTDFNDTFSYTFDTPNIGTYQSPSNAYTLAIELLIEDNTAKSLELALKQQGFRVQVKRYHYYEVEDKNVQKDSIALIKASAELFNDSKERVAIVEDKALNLVVFDKEDVFGRQKTRTLQTVFNMTSLKGIKHGVLYTFDVENKNAASLKAFLNDSHLLCNLHVQDCYEYGR